MTGQPGCSVEDKAEVYIICFQIHKTLLKKEEIISLSISILSRIKNKRNFCFCIREGLGWPERKTCLKVSRVKHSNRMCALHFWRLSKTH